MNVSTLVGSFKPMPVVKPEKSKEVLLAIAATVMLLCTVIAANTASRVVASVNETVVAPDQVPDFIANELATIWGVSTADAVARYQLEGVQKGWAENLTNDGLAGDGVYLDEGVLVVNAMAANEEAVSSWVSSFVDSGEATSEQIRMNSVDYGMQELTNAKAEVTAIGEQFPETILANGILLKEGVVDVMVDETLPQAEKLAVTAELEKLGHVQVGEGQTESSQELDPGDGEPVDNGDISPSSGFYQANMGSRWTSVSPSTAASCTAGFYVEDRTSGDRFLTTAGHCLSPIKNEPVHWNRDLRMGTASYEWFSANPKQDVGLIELNNDWRGFNGYQTPVGNPITRFISSLDGGTLVGETVCKIGGVSGPNTELCGELNTQNVDVVLGGAALQVYGFKACGKNGDSGSPVVGSGTERENTGVGIYVGQATRAAGFICVAGYYERIDKVLDAYSSERGNDLSLITV